MPVFPEMGIRAFLLIASSLGWRYSTPAYSQGGVKFSTGGKPG